MIDFSEILFKDKKNLKQTVEKYNGDPSLRYTLSKRIYHINKDIDFSKLKSKEELPFVLYNNFDYIVDMDVGPKGTEDYCKFFKDNFLYDCLFKAVNKNLNIILGHTHPTFLNLNRIYGALPSRIFFDEKNVFYDPSLALSDSYVFKYFIDIKLYKKYGGDYCEYYTLMKIFKPIINIGTIYNTFMDTLGLFGFYDKGNIKYFKWKII